jgi:hypothetical protein
MTETEFEIEGRIVAVKIGVYASEDGQGLPAAERAFAR